ALDPEELAIPERILAVLAPRPYGWVPGRTRWDTDATSPAFDQIGAARTLASRIVGGVLHPRRAARVVAFHARNPALPSLEDVVLRLVDGAWSRPDAGAPLNRVVQRVVVDELMDLAASTRATPEVSAAATWGLRQVMNRANSPAGPEQEAHVQSIRADVERFLAREWDAGEGADPPQAPGWSRDLDPEVR
ncbi:MAG TPA: hypothetical protein VK966_12870, partial [Longimicrobiales bacterium]|nr:hypothetical protein [Longimicrobiales bacterium]